MERYGFKFPLYSEVKTKIKSDMKFMIVERILTECPGGTQRHYKVRGYIITKDYTNREPMIAPTVKLSIYNECELELVR